MDRSNWPLWLRQLEEFYEKTEKVLWVSLSLDQAYELADLGLLLDEEEIDDRYSAVNGVFEVIRSVSYPGQGITAWVISPVRIGETAYSIKLEHQTKRGKVEKKWYVPTDRRFRRDPHPLDKAGWNTEESELFQIPLFDDVSEEMFYVMTRRPPPEYPGHRWYHSGWTYARGRAGVDLCLAFISRAEREAKHREEESRAVQNWNRLRAEKRAQAAKQAELDRFLAEEVQGLVAAALKREEELDEKKE